MMKKEIAEKYLFFLSRGDVKNIVSLFSEKGKIYSPIYGEQSASDFFEILNDDTTCSELKLNGIFEDSINNKIAVYFEYKWTIKTGEVVLFDVVDIISFDDENKILELKIIYDTVVSRRLIEELKADDS